MSAVASGSVWAPPGLALVFAACVRLMLPGEAEAAAQERAARTPAGALIAFTMEDTERGAEAVIQADGTMTHRLYAQEDPLRLVIDILDVANPLEHHRPRPDHPLVSWVRMYEYPLEKDGSGQPGGTIGRAVFELKQPADYRIAIEPQKLRVYLTLKKTAAPSESGTPGPSVAATEAAEAGGDAEMEHVGGRADPLAPSIEPPGTDPAAFFGPPPEHSDHYTLGPEDILEIQVFELQQLNRTVRVSADGSVELPLVGKVAVLGLTAEEVAEAVAEHLGDRYVQNPQVSVFIAEFNSRKVSLLGAVKEPATYPLAGRRTLLQLLAEAGGLSAEAGSVLYVFRQTSGGRSARLSVPLTQLLIEGDPRWNIWLQPGDAISVPPGEAVSVSVLGAVRSPGIYKLPVGEGASLLNAIARAGGLTDRASKSGVQIQRREASAEESVLKVNLGDILSGKSPDVILQEGDVVVVKESFF